MQDEDNIKKQETAPVGTLLQQANEEIQTKISIPIPEEQKSLKTCRLYSGALHSPRIHFMMSFLVVLALTVWWLVFL